MGDVLGGGNCIGGEMTRVWGETTKGENRGETTWGENMLGAKRLVTRI